MEITHPQLTVALYVKAKKKAFSLKLSPFTEAKVCQVSKLSHIHSISIRRQTYSVRLVTSLFH